MLAPVEVELNHNTIQRLWLGKDGSRPSRGWFRVEGFQCISTTYWTCAVHLQQLH